MAKKENYNRYRSVNVGFRVTPEEAEEIYKNLEIDELIEKAYKEREIIKLTATGEPVKKTE